MTNATKITVESTLTVSTEKAWEFYNNPEHITKWNFASDDWHCPKAENDLRVGGKLLSRMEAKDGSWGFDFEAIYDEVIPLEKISYIMGDGRKVTTTFTNNATTTKVTTNFETEQENPTEMQQSGWQAILNNYKNYTEQNA